MTTTTPRTAPPDRYFRLAEGIRPALYNARLDIHVDERRFSGQIDIEINASEPIGEVLRLHADRLQADRVDLNGAPVNNWELEPESETLRIELDGSLGTGKHLLSISYRGDFSSQDMFGLYWAGDVAITQFESAYARRVFPCFDEPAFKAPWQITVSAENRYTILSNGSPEDERVSGGEELPERAQQLGDVLEVQAGGRLVEQEQLGKDGVRAEFSLRADIRP